MGPQFVHAIITPFVHSVNKEKRLILHALLIIKRQQKKREKQTSCYIIDWVCWLNINNSRTLRCISVNIFTGTHFLNFLVKFVNWSVHLHRLLMMTIWNWLKGVTLGPIENLIKPSGSSYNMTYDKILSCPFVTLCNITINHNLVIVMQRRVTKGWFKISP